MKVFSDNRNKWLINKINQLIDSGTTKAEIARALEVKPQYLTPIMNGTRNVSEKFAFKFCEVFNINSNDLFPVRRKIPFYDINAEAGTIQLSSMDPVSEPGEWIDAGDWFRDADGAMRVHGDSMFPVYKSGSIVVMKEVQDKSLVIYGQDYVLQTSEYRAIKRIQKSKQKDFWLACSVNTETWEKGEMAGKLIHEPFEIPIDKVNKLFRVVGSVDRTESSRIVYNKKKTL